MTDNPDNQLNNIEGPAPEQADSQSEIGTLAGYAKMLKEIRSWGFWSIGLGIIHMIGSGFLSAPWGIMLIFVGLSSFLFKSSSMFIIYAVTLAWAALSNISGLDLTWVFFALFQLYLSYRVFRQFGRFRKVEKEFHKLASSETEENPPPPDLAARSFPWIGSLLSCSSITGFVVLIIITFVILIETEGLGTMPSYLGFLEGLTVNFAVLGFSVGLASLLSSFRPKWLGIIAIIFGALTLLIEIGLLFLV
jgi:hypothetical protein